MAFKDFLKKILNREPTEQEISEGEKELTGGAAPPIEPIVPPTQPTGIDKALIERMERMEKTTSALLTKLEAAEKRADESEQKLVEQAKIDLQTKIQETIKEAKEKKLLPADNKELEEKWTKTLNADFENGKSLLMANPPINAGNPPAGDAGNGKGTQSGEPANNYQSIRQAAVESIRASVSPAKN